MMGVEHFVPAGLAREEEIIPRLRSPVPSGVTEAYVQAYTEPGETVLVPYCQGVGVVHEILSLRRRALAFGFNPVVGLLVGTCLSPPADRELDAAVARLGNSLKQGVPLRHYLEDLFATTCPACLRPATADFYVWDREPEAPVAKHVQCPACGWDEQTAIEPADRERLAEVQPQGMHYHYLLDRVLPNGQGELRSRVMPHFKLYSPRNLYALAELTLRIESLFAEGPLLQALRILLLDCLDRCSFLAQPTGKAARGRGLSRPPRSLERNVWRTFEQAVRRFRVCAEQGVAGVSDSLARFQSNEEPCAAYVGHGLVRDLPRLLAPRSIRLVLFSPPPLDPAVWSLSSFWGAWLLGAQAVSSLRPLLRQRSADPDWYAGVMAAAFHTLTELLRDEGRLVLVLTSQTPEVLEALVMAASAARLCVAQVLQCGSDYRLELAPTPLSRASARGQTLVPRSSPVTAAHTLSPSRPGTDAPGPTGVGGPLVKGAVLESATEAISTRGEPVGWLTLHAAVQHRLAGLGLLTGLHVGGGQDATLLHQIAEQVRVGLEHRSLVRLEAEGPPETLWWLADHRLAAVPLSDRVEVQCCDVLQDATALTAADFQRAVFRLFPGLLTPDPELVANCLHSYAFEASPGLWQLRPEDQAGARRVERQALIEQLRVLGCRLGYESTPSPPWDVTWSGVAGVRAGFLVRWQATLGEVLALCDQTGGTTPYLVLPGGRAGLASYKLARNPVLKQGLAEGGWQFIKYRHVRELVARAEIDEYALRTIVGLDPIVERESVQLSLF